VALRESETSLGAFPVNRALAEKRFLIARQMCRFLPPLLARKVRNWLYSPGNGRYDNFEVITAAQTGSLLRVKTSDYHGYRFSVHGYHDWRNYVIALSLCPAGSSIVEIGANIGTETVGFADIVGHSGKVYAFEPLPVNLEALYDMVALNHFEHVTIFPVAVGQEQKQVQFAVPSQENTGLGRIVQVSNVNAPDQVITVECLPLDSLLETIGSARLIFIDAEGGEIPILRGATSYLRTYKPALVLEAAPAHLAEAGYTLEKLYGDLSDLGYDVYRVKKVNVIKLLPADFANVQPKSNWLCLPAGSDAIAQLVQRNLRRCGLLPCVAGLNPLKTQQKSPQELMMVVAKDCRG
jgi:FkbM family methyltransferase